jgi:hypothetical protein
MALTLSAHQSTLTRPTRPNVGANGIAHATRSGGTTAQTKADRIVTKAAWVVWSDAWKATYRASGDHATAFTVSGSAITYAGD